VLREAGLAWVRLDGSTRDRAGVVARFQAEDGPPVFLVSLKAGGTGLNLTAADYVFHLDPWWNPAVEQQATDRAHRIGQRRPVVSVKLVAADTVEERILQLQDRKRALVERVVDEGALVEALSAEEMRALLD
jgi:SNF2 family DNA or RNA helicase